jgi:DNA-binding winged helix-turn-helix (wHTH) protein/tetratricopeptide (TPR) repeat protein
VIYNFADCELDTTRFELRRDGTVTPVEPQVFDLLRYLVENRTRVVTREELFEKIWSGRFVSEATLSSRIMAARRAVGDSGSAQNFIRTARGRGFRFVGDVLAREPTDGAPATPDRPEPESYRAASIPAPYLLLERSAQLEELSRLHEAVAGGAGGRVALVRGEAGIGKSALVSSFCAAAGRTSRLFVGTCDALTTPRPLGPLHDIARAAGPPLSSLLGSAAARDPVITALLSLIERPDGVTILLFEDLHWSDEATLDVLISVARRLAPLPLLLILTYRSDEVGSSHPLRRLLGELPTNRTTRIALEPLSLASVAELARNDPARAARIHSLTGGNPFYVTEVVAGADEELPATVSDAVLARLRRCSGSAREMIELLAASPQRLSLEVISKLMPQCDEALEEALESGILDAAGDQLFFRHELGRLAVVESLPVTRRRQIHRRYLEHYTDGATLEDDELTIAMHHARAAGHGELVIRLAPRAAAVASSLGAHKEAAAHYQAALHHRNQLNEPDVAGLLEGLSYECYLTRDIEEAVETRTRALELREAAGEMLEVGRNLRWLSRLHWFAGRNREAHHFAARAVETLSQLPAGVDLAMAFSNRSQLKMLGGDLSATLRWGERAILLATELNDEVVLAHALTNVGLARLSALEPEGEEQIRRALEICLRERDQENAARAYTALATGGLGIRNYPLSRHYLEEGIAYCETHDLDAWTSYLYAYLARWELECGSWVEGAKWASMVTGRSGVAAITRIAALVPLALISGRRGEIDGAWLMLDEALGLAETTGELQRLAPVAAARAEIAWLEGNVERIASEVSQVYELAQRKTRSWDREQLAFWLWRGGKRVELNGALTPFGLQVEEKWREAAGKWRELGCRWELALALAQGDADAMKEAARLFDHLGSPAAARVVRSQPMNRLPRSTASN